MFILGFYAGLAIAALFAGAAIKTEKRWIAKQDRTARIDRILHNARGRYIGRNAR